MEDDRDRYLPELDAQADGLADYFFSFIAASQRRQPWTIELINCGLAIGNIAYMYYKQFFKRVRPSVLCPGLIPPFGPPEHPSFPSGHSFLGHLCGLLLLEIPAIRYRYGIFDATSGTMGKAVDPYPKPPVASGAAYPVNPLDGWDEKKSPMLWLALRLGKNRERLGVHYPSDTMVSRHLAAAIWRAILHETKPDKRIVCPTLDTVIRYAAAEWPTPW